MKNKPKVMHIITRLDMGGSAQNTLLTSIGLAEQYEVVLVYGLSHESHMTELEQETVDEQINLAKRKRVKTIIIPTLVRKIGLFQDLRAFFSLWRLISVEKPAIVHTHSSKAGILGRLAAWLSGIPIIIHTPHGHVFFGHFNPVVSKIFLLIEKIFDRITHCVVALTDGEKKDYVKLSVSKADKIVKIHSGVPIDQYMDLKINIDSKKKAIGLASQGLVIGTVGWLLPIKGPEYLLEAMIDVWQGHPEVHLVFVGKGDLEEKLKTRAAQIGVADKVLFLGWRNDIPEIMQLFDIFVLPSLNEGMGRVIVEAMAAGKPVVASNVGGIPDLVEHAKNGFLFEPGNSKQMSQEIKRLLGNQTLQNEMGLIGKKRSINFNVEKMIEKINNTYLTFLRAITIKDNILN
jgi:glycosyltransferase involved in cell wall biosynthesis